MSKKPWTGEVTEVFHWPFPLSDGEAAVWDNVTARMKKHLMSQAEKAVHFDAILQIIAVDNYEEIVMGKIIEYCDENKIDYK